MPTLLNVAAGGTDLGTDLRRKGILTAVTSLDPTYPEAGAQDARPSFIHGYAQKLPFEDKQFSSTLCQFGMQHLPQETVGNAIREMVRVTQTAYNRNDATKGAILINPVFRPRKLAKALEELRIGNIAGINWHDEVPVGPGTSRIVKPTLWIQKTESLTPEKLEEIISAASTTKALRSTHWSLGEVVARSMGGHSNI